MAFLTILFVLSDLKLFNASLKKGDHFPDVHTFMFLSHANLLVDFVRPIDADHLQLRKENLCGKHEIAILVCAESFLDQFQKMGFEREIATKIKQKCDEIDEELLTLPENPEKEKPEFTKSELCALLQLLRNSDMQESNQDLHTKLSDKIETLLTA